MPFLASLLKYFSRENSVSFKTFFSKTSNSPTFFSFLRRRSSENPLPVLLENGQASSQKSICLSFHFLQSAILFSKIHKGSRPRPVQNHFRIKARFLFKSCKFRRALSLRPLAVYLPRKLSLLTDCGCLCEIKLKRLCSDRNETKRKYLYTHLRVVYTKFRMTNEALLSFDDGE